MSEQIETNLPVKYEPKPPKKSLWSSVVEVFHSDIVWYSIALGCILGVLLFYFQGLQPLLLRYHVVETKTHLIQLESTYADQVESVKSLQSKYSSKFLYSSSDLCEQQELYTTFNEDGDDMERLKVTLLPVPKANTFESVGTLSEVKNEYNRVYDVYEDTLGQIRTISEGFQGIPAYLNYTNAWITACRQLEESTGLNSEVIALCNEVRESRVAFDSATKPFFWSEVQQQHDEGLQVCDSLGELPTSRSVSGFNDFKLEWLSAYGQVRQFVPDSFSQLEPINSLIEEFSTEYSRNDAELLGILKSRQSFGGMWYVLNYGSKEY